MKLLLPLILIAVFPLAFALAQEQPVRAVQANTVSVSAQGEFDAEPDTALIRFSISTTDKTAKAAYDRAARSADQVRETLRSAGVDPSAAKFGYFSLHPIYDYKGNGKRKIVQFNVDSSVVLRLKQFDKVGPLLDQLATLDITGDQSLNYILEDSDAAKAKAVHDAMIRAKAEAEAVARAADRTLGALVWASVDTQERIRPLAAPQIMTMEAGAAMAKMAPPPTEGFTPASVTVTAQVNALFSLK